MQHVIYHGNSHLYWTSNFNRMQSKPRLKDIVLKIEKVDLTIKLNDVAGLKGQLKQKIV